MISIRNINKTFVKEVKKQTIPVRALDGVNLEIKPSEFVSIIGPSGCGKTTLLKIVDGLVRQDSGEIYIEGKKVVGPGPDRAVVFQNFALLPWGDVIRNVAFGLELRGVQRKEREDVARKWIEVVGLRGFEHHYPSELSGGMQQRVGLARALAVDPKVLLMDEPFGAVDAQTRQLLQEELLRIWQQQKKTVIFITHSMDEAVYLSDRVVIMRPRPGRVAELVDVPIPRPRDESEVRKTAQFVELTAYIWDTLKRMMRESAELAEAEAV